MTSKERMLTAVTTYVIEPLIKKNEEIFILKKYQPIPYYDQKAVTQRYDEVGDDGILRGGGFGNQGGCWQDACYLHGTEEMIMAAFDKPEWVHDEAVRKEVFRLFEAFGKNGGYIMSASDHFFQVPKENLKAYAEAAWECGY